MPRKKYIRNDRFPYHVTARCINKDWFRIPIEEVWAITSDYLFFINYTYKVKIHSFVLMNNHFHLVISAPNMNLSEAMNYFMREVSRQITRISGRINSTFGSRFHRSLIPRYHHYMNVYKYVYRNPIEAGLARCVEQYKFSTLHGLLGQSKITVPVAADTVIFCDEVDRNLQWLNTKPPKFLWNKMKTGLRKSVFELSVDQRSRKPCTLEVDLL